MTNESIVTQWREPIANLLWVRAVGTRKHPIALTVRWMGSGWQWDVWDVEGGAQAEGQTPSATLPDTKSAATEAGYALLERLESEEVAR